MKINKKDLGDKLTEKSYDIFLLGLQYGRHNSKFNENFIMTQIRQKIFSVLDSIIISKEDELREAGFESRVLEDLISEV